VTSVSRLLVGLNLIGLVGLRRAIETAEASGLEDREEIVALMMESLADSNYISPAASDEYRLALWREYMRHRGEDIRPFYSAIEVTVHAQPGPDLDRFLEILGAVLARHELKPLVTVEPPSPQGASPLLRIDDEVVVAGTTDPDRIARGIGKRISHW
jgi:hypothetical protein